MWFQYRVFRLERSRRRLNPFLICISLISWVASLPAVFIAAFKSLEYGWVLAGFAASFAQVTCSLQASRTARKILFISTSIILLVEALTMLLNYLIALSQNNVITGITPGAAVRILSPLQSRADCSWQCIWAFSQAGHWCWTLGFSYDIYQSRMRRNLSSEPAPTSSITLKHRQQRGFASCDLETLNSELSLVEDGSRPIIANRHPEILNSESSPVEHVTTNMNEPSGNRSSIVILPSPTEIID